MRFHQNTGESQGKGDRAASDRQGSLDLPPRQEEAWVDFLRSGKILQGLDNWR